MPVKRLPANPHLTHLKAQAKDLMKALVRRDAAAAQRVREFHPRFRGAEDAAIFDAPFRLSDAQLAIARERGFASWARLKQQVERPAASNDLQRKHHERIEDPGFRHAVELLDAGDAEGLRKYLTAHPGLARQRIRFEGENYFQNPSLLEFAAENPIRHGSLPPGALEAVRVILEAGARLDAGAVNETLGLVCSGRVARECGVQVPLIGLLCEYGADPNRGVEAALAHGEFEAVRALLAKGAKASLVTAAALGEEEAEVRRLLGAAEGEERRQALAVAAQFGRAEAVRLLLEAGVDPNQYNPRGFHSHSTPLHQAALAGHAEVVRLLVAGGARLDVKDTMWAGTPAGWARHGGQAGVAEWLEERVE